MNRAKVGGVVAYPPLGFDFGGKGGSLGLLPSEEWRVRAQGVMRVRPVIDDHHGVGTRRKVCGPIDLVGGLLAENRASLPRRPLWL